jgi:glycosyltransferase involved in cell wall biosynthesis
VASILLVLQSTQMGGMEMHSRYHAAELRRRGMRVTMIVPTYAIFDDLARAICDDGSTVIRLDTDARYGRARQLRSNARLLRVMRAHRPDTIHLHTGGASGGLIVVAVARLFSRATVIVSEHDVPAPTPLRWDRGARWVMDRLTHRLVAVSRRNATLRRTRLGTPVAKLASVLNGVPIPAIDRAEACRNRVDVRREVGIPGDAVVFGCLVRLADGKGLPDLLRAFAQMRDGPPTALLLVGDGPLRRELTELAAQLGVGERVHLVGHQVAPAPYLDAMDVFVLAVPAGSMSIALLETMARGLPPIITFCGPEEAVVHERTGLCAPPNDPEGLAAAMRRTATDPALRRRLGAVAARYVARRFSSARVADDLLSVYRSRSADGLPARLRVEG